jgi:release factor glutamine methyltransferase
MPTVADLLAEARPLLAATSFGAPVREALLLLGAVLGLSEAQILARPERGVGEAEAARFRALLARRLHGEPVAYLLGEREFYGRSFFVDDRVLVPRPETEHLVEAALAEPLPAEALVLDVGTGSGCLAVTLALERPGWRLVASDLSPAALAVAAANARRLGAAGRVLFLACDLLAGLDLSRFDLVVSNPPYIDPAVASTLSSEVCNFEPHLALFAPDGGGAVLRRLIAGGCGLRLGVALMLEIGHDQELLMREAAAASGLGVEGIDLDLAGLPRLARLRR